MATKVTKDRHPQILTIVGEQVSLLPTGLAGVDNIIVSFDDKYKPKDITKEEEVLLKKTLQRLFSGSGLYFGNPNPSPPCKKVEKDLVLKSLGYRYNKLRSLVQAEKQRDSVYFRQSLKHLFDLKGYIDWFVKAPCVDAKDDEFTGELGKLSDDQIKALLKQFIFLILQGQHPLDGYEKQDPNPAAFIGRLEKGAIPDFKEYIKQYQEHEFEIPERILKVMEVADLDLEALRKQIDDRVAQKLKEIILKIRALLTDSNDPIWEGINLDHPTPDMIVTLFERLLKRVDETKTKLATANTEIETLKQALEACKQSIAAKDDEIKLAMGRVTMAEAQRKELEAKIAEGLTGAEALQEALDHANETIGQLQSIIQRLTAENKLLDEKYKELLIRLDQQTAEIEELRKEIEALRTQLGNLQSLQTENAELKTKITALEEEAARLRAQLEELDTLRGQMTENQRQITEKEDLLQRLTQENKEKTGVIKSLEDQIADALEAKKKYEEELEALKEDRKTNQRKLEELAGEYERDTTGADRQQEEAAARITELENLLAAAEANAKGLQDIINELEATINNLTEELEAEKAKGKGAAAAATEAEKAIAALQGEIDGLTAENKRLAEEAAGKNTEAQQTQGEYDRALRELQDKYGLSETARIECEKKLATAIGERDALQARIDELMAQLKKQKNSGKASDDAKVELQGEIDDLRQQLIENNNQILELTQQLDLATAGKGECEEKLAAALREKAASDKRITDLEAQIKQLQADIKKGKGDNAVLAQLIKNLELERESSTGLRREIDELRAQIALIQAKRKKTEKESEDKDVVIQGQADELEDLRKEKGKAEDCDRLQEIIKQVAVWVGNGAKKGEKPIITGDNIRKYAIVKTLLDNISKLPLMSPENQTKKMIDDVNRCYLIFFGSYLWSRHLPPQPERAFDAFKAEIKLLVDQCLNGAAAEPAQGRAAVEGVYNYLVRQGNPDKNPTVFVLNTLIKVLYELENIHNSHNKGVYLLNFAFLDPQEKKLMMELWNNANVLIEKSDKPGILGKGIKLVDFQNRLTSYMGLRGAQIDRDLTTLSIQFHGARGENLENSMIVYGDDPTGAGKGVPKLLFNSKAELDNYTKNKVYTNQPGVVKAPDAAILMKNNSFLSFGFLFYVFLIVFKDYLNEIEVNNERCPLPTILQKPRAR